MNDPAKAPWGRLLGALLGALPLLGVPMAKAQTGSETWQMIGPQSASVFSGARDPSNPLVFLVGTYYGGVYRSFDGGFTWQHLEGPLASAAVFTMRADPTAPGTFYAGAFERGIYRTTDIGQTWEPLNNGLTNTSVVGLAVNPLDGDELLAATFAGISRSTDRGASWTAPTTGGTEPAISVLFSGETNGTCYAGLDRNGIVRSTDSGATWSAWNDGLPPVITVLWLEPDPDDPDTVYLGSDKGVYRRAEGDAAWTDLNFNLPPDVATNHIAFHADGRIFAATEVGAFTLNTRDATIWYNWTERPSRFVFIQPFGSTIHLAQTELEFLVTVNDGIGFADAGLGIQNNFPDALASVASGGSSYLFAGSDLGVFRVEGPSIPPSPAWYEPAELEGELILKLRPDPNNPDVLFAGTERAGVWRTDDLGLTWSQKSDGLTPNTVTSISQSSEGDHLTYAGTSTGLFISEDGGDSWRVGPEVAIPSFVSAVEADGAAPDIAYFGTNFGEVIVTINGGLTFQSSFDLPDEPVVRIASAPFRDVFAVMASGRVFSSKDQGMIWSPKDQEINHPGSDLDFSQDRPWRGFLATLGGGVYRTTSEGTEWDQVNTGIDNPFLFSIVLDRLDDQIIYTGSVGTVFKSTDHGESWTAWSTGLPVDGKISELAIDPLDRDIVYASILEHGIYVSEDAGETWVPRGTDGRFVDTQRIPIASSFAVPGRVFAGSRLRGVFRSDDRGRNWEGTSDGMADLVRAVQVSYQDSNRVYAGTLNSGMFRSDDGGENWTNSGLEGRQIIHSAINRFDGHNVYAATSTGLAATFDGGDTWQDLGQRLALVFALASDPLDRSTLFLGGPAGRFFTSRDGGLTSTGGGAGLPNANMRALWRTGGGVLFAGMGVGAGVYRSNDDGATWSKISTGQFATERANGVLLDEGTGELFVIGDRTGLLRSDADGTTWTPIPVPGGDPVLNPLSTFRIDPFDPNRFAVARFNQSGADQALHFSPDRGSSWATVAGGSGLPAGSIWTVEFSPHTEGVLLAAHESGLYRSTDGGANWVLLYTPPEGILYRLLFDPSDPRTIYAGGSEGGIFISTDRGDTWSPAPSDPAGVEVSTFAPGANGAVHAATFQSGLLTTRDHGQSWTPGIDGGLTQFVANFVALDPADPRTIYVASSNEGVLKSTNGGFTWTRMNTGLEGNLTALAIIVDPEDPDVIYLGTISDGVYVSEDAGDSWSPLRTGMFHEIVIALTTDAADHRTVYAGVEGGGTYQIRRGPKALSPDKDFDKDGIITIVEEYMGLDPLTPNRPGLYQGRFDRETGRYALRWQEAVPSTGITAVPEWSPNLVDWYASGDGPGGTGPLIVVSDLGVHPAGIRVREAYLTAGGGTRFLRLSLSR